MPVIFHYKDYIELWLTICNIGGKIQIGKRGNKHDNA